MFNHVHSIPTGDAPTYLPAVDFSPDGSRFVATFKDIDTVRLFDTATLELLREWSGASAQLDFPHGVALTNRHLIVSNKHKKFPSPSTLHVYRIDDDKDDPVSVLRTPDDRLVEAHSLALRGDCLLATYCEGRRALVSYRFDDETGALSGPIDLQGDWLSVYGDPKGVAFTPDGSRVAVTFASVPPARGFLRNFWKLVRGQLSPIRFVQATGLDAVWPFSRTAAARKNGKGITNGIAVFDVGPDGKIARDPSEMSLWPVYSRLENTSIVDNLCVVADALKNEVSLYRFDGNKVPAKPEQVIADQLAFPHDACLSPDQQTLVIANNGITSRRGHILWEERIEGADRLDVYRRVA